MNFTDAAPVQGARLTNDGYLVADAFALRTGVQVYRGAEVGKPELATVSVYRPEAEVFATDSLASLSHVPLTVDHPTVAVDAANWRDLAVGETGGEVLRDGQRLRVPLIVKDARAIASVQGGKRELSAGYQCELVWKDGTTADGEPYQAVQTKIRFNHLAIVDRARAGTEFRIGDGAGAWGAAPILPTNIKDTTTMTLKTVFVDGIPIEVTDQGATVIDTLQKRLTDSAANIAKLTADHASALAAKDSDLAKRDAALDDLKAKVLTDADIDKRVQARGDLVASAALIAKDVKTSGLSDADIRKAVVVAKLGDAAIKDKTSAYIDARFEILAEDAAKGADPIRRAIGDGATVEINDLRANAEKARLNRDQALRDGWKTAASSAAN